MDARVCGRVCVCVCVDMRIDMCVDMCIEMCRDKCIDMFIDMCTDVCTDMCMDTCMDMCMNSASVRPTKRNRRAANEPGMVVLYGHAVWTCCMDMLYGHAVWTWLYIGLYIGIADGIYIASEAVILSTVTPIPAQWRCRRRFRYRADIGKRAVVWSCCMDILYGHVCVHAHGHVQGQVHGHV